MKNVKNVISDPNENVKRFLHISSQKTIIHPWNHQYGKAISVPHPLLKYTYVWRESFYTRIWANAQRGGCSAEYRWRPLFNAAKFGWRRLLECRSVMLPRRETRWNSQGCPKLPNRSQLLVGRSSPYCEDIWRRYCGLTSFFPIGDICLSC